MSPTTPKGTALAATTMDTIGLSAHSRIEMMLMTRPQTAKLLRRREVCSGAVPHGLSLGADAGRRGLACSLHERPFHQR